jgi:hypothetical protein
VIKINVMGADPAPQQKLPGLGPDTTSGSASGIKDFWSKSTVLDSSTPLGTLRQLVYEILDSARAH